MQMSHYISLKYHVRVFTICCSIFTFISVYLQKESRENDDKRIFQNNRNDDVVALLSRVNIVN